MFTVGYGCARLFLLEGSDFSGQIALRVGAFLYAFLHSRGSLQSIYVRLLELVMSRWYHLLMSDWYQRKCFWGIRYGYPKAGDIGARKFLPKLYASRWGIETSFRDLKYTVGMLDFHSKKVMCIHQEIYAHLIMYNFAEIITSHIVIERKQRKYTYKANFSIAAHMCRLFYRGKATSPNLETIIARHIIPVRNDRHRKRNLTIKVFHGFLYRVA